MNTRILHIATNTFREAVRDRVLYNLIAFALLLTGAAVLVDTRDQRLYDNLHPVGAVSIPLAEIEATGGRLPARPPVHHERRPAGVAHRGVPPADP